MALHGASFYDTASTAARLPSGPHQRRKYLCDKEARWIEEIAKRGEARGETVNLSAAEKAVFRRRLLGWFHRQKRDLPWRRTKEPYHIWLSEIMLQQTRVAAVLPYFRRFVRRFPTLRALARARSEPVLQLWAGLGYYNRARNLHRAAKEIVARHGGCFPQDLEAALRLPGIGRYTAAAVLSIGYGAPYAVLDGNVARVLARLGAVRGNLRSPRRWNRLQSTAQDLLATKTPGDWNQAMMELGATLCTPRAPRCGDCPVSPWCQAHQLGIANALPTARRKRSPVQIEIAAAVLLDERGRTLLVKHVDGASPERNSALFSRMWQFPALNVSRHAQTELAQLLQDSFGLDGDRLIPLPPVRHTVTFHDLTLRPFLARVRTLPAVARLSGSEVSARHTPLGQLDRLPVSSATRKIAAAALRFA